MLVDFSGSPHGGSIKLLPEAYKQAQIEPVGLVDHSIVGSGLGAWYYFRDKTGAESTFINNLNGWLWQCMPCDRVADAQVDGSYFTIGSRRCGLLSIEHADNGDPDNFGFTQAQIESDIWLHDKLARRFGWPRRRISAPTGEGAQGLGFHSMWLDTRYMYPDRTHPWTSASGKTCPGRPVRVRQWETILLPAFIKGTPGEDELSAADVEAINKHTDEAAAELYRRIARAEFDGKVLPTHLGNSLAGLRTLISGQGSALTAVRLAADAIRADQAVSGDREVKALALLAEIEADLPEPAVPPTGG